MIALLFAVTVFVILIALLLFIVGALRPGDNRPSIGAYRAPDRVGGVITGLVAALATTGVLSTANAPASENAAAGVFVGLAFSVLSAVGSARLVGLGGGVFGVLGFGSTAWLFLVGECGSLQLWVRVIVALSVAFSGGLGFLAAFITGKVRFESFLWLFAAFHVVVFLASPFGLSMTELPWLGAVILFASAILLGFAAAIAPALIIGLAAIAVSVASVHVDFAYGSICSSGDPRGLVLIISFLVAYSLVPLVSRLVPQR